MDKSLEDFKGVDTTADGVLVYKSSVKEHDRNCRNMLQLCRKEGTGDNSEIRATELQFYGNLITSKGL